MRHSAGSNPASETKWMGYWQFWLLDSAGSNPSIPTKCFCGGIGRRNGLKIRPLIGYGFDSRQKHQRGRHTIGLNSVWVCHCCPGVRTTEWIIVIRGICPVFSFIIFPIILEFHIYIINMNKSETSIQKGGRITMNETYGEIVVTPVPAGDTVICG